jgi:hypothetical protein
MIPGYTDKMMRPTYPARPRLTMHAETLAALGGSPLPVDRPEDTWVIKAEPPVVYLVSQYTTETATNGRSGL